MKKLIQILAVAVGLAVLLPGANAQTGYNWNTLLAGGTNNVTELSTNTTFAGFTTTPVIHAPLAGTIGLEFSYKMISACNLSNIVVTFSRSLDGVNYETTGAHSFTTLCNGTNTVGVVTNITLGACGYLKLTGLNTTATNAMTNVVMRWSYKNGI